MFRRRIFWILRRQKNFSTYSNVIASQLRQVSIPKVSLHEYLWTNLEKWSDRTAVTCFETHQSYTFYQLYKRSLALTKFFKDSLKLQHQETICMVLPNVIEYPIIVLGAIQAGLKVTTSNPASTPEELRKQLIDSKATAIFTSPQYLPMVRQAISNIKTNIAIIEVANRNGTTTGVIKFDEISVGDGVKFVQDIDVNETVFLLYSSGTTGMPKGVELTHSNVVSNLCQMKSPEIDLLHQDTVPVFLPMFHVYGLVYIALNVMNHGSKLVVMSKFNTQNFVTLLKDYKPDVVFGVPLVVIMAVNNPNITTETLNNIRTIVSGAAPLGASDVERFKAKAKNQTSLLQAYGMTELSPVALQQSALVKNGIKTGGSGCLFPNTEAKIISTDGSTSTGLGCNQPGQLLIRGPQVMKGYLSNPEANNETFMEDGWLKTGDIAYYDEHEHFYITDRVKELIKVKGFQVAPAELEAILRDHPCVEETAVVGVPHDAYGEVPKAFVVVKSGASVKAEQLQTFAAQHVAKYKRLTGGVVFVDDIPKSPSGKILRRLLRNK